VNAAGSRRFAVSQTEARRGERAASIRSPVCENGDAERDPFVSSERFSVPFRDVARGHVDIGFVEMLA
jgi:hypothetical protein